MFTFIAALMVPALMAAPSAPPSAPVDSAEMMLVVVQNDRKVPTTVYAETDYGEYKLGVVAPESEMTLSLADYMTGQGSIQFFVHPAGQLEESSQPLDLHRGERIGLVVPRR